MYNVFFVLKIGIQINIFSKNNWSKNFGKLFVWINIFVENIPLETRHTIGTVFLMNRITL